MRAVAGMSQVGYGVVIGEGKGGGCRSAAEALAVVSSPDRQVIHVCKRQESRRPSRNAVSDQFICIADRTSAHQHLIIDLFGPECYFRGPVLVLSKYYARHLLSPSIWFFTIGQPRSEFYDCRSARTTSCQDCRLGRSRSF